MAGIELWTYRLAAKYPTPQLNSSTWTCHFMLNHLIKFHQTECGDMTAIDSISELASFSNALIRRDKNGNLSHSAYPKRSIQGFHWVIQNPKAVFQCRIKYCTCKWTSELFILLFCGCISNYAYQPLKTSPGSFTILYHPTLSTTNYVPFTLLQCITLGSVSKDFEVCLLKRFTTMSHVTNVIVLTVLVNSFDAGPRFDHFHPYQSFSINHVNGANDG